VEASTAPEPTTPDEAEAPAGPPGLAAMVRAALPRWGLSPASRVTLLNVSENVIFRIDDPAAGAKVLRLHRPGYHSVEEIRSELAWIGALREDAVLATPAPLGALDGALVQRLPCASGGAARHAVLFAFAEGREPQRDADLAVWFRRLGGLTARLHRHARSWRPPPGFRRKSWTVGAMLGPNPIWGDWRAGPGLDAASRRLIARAAALVEMRLRRFGTAPERFGLIHADLRLANLLVDGDALTVLDFDDCGFGFYATDFASAVSFFEHDPAVPALMQSWLAGYREVAPLDAETEAELPVFLMLRRILLLAWLGSHAETLTARDLGNAYGEQTAAMAEDLLARFR
jgi:Ser/Thr protein kinase RdoA (MazF antagonist)